MYSLLTIRTIIKKIFLVGEVVYGKVDILKNVISYWMDLKLQYKEFGRLPHKQMREEGVIFPDCKVNHKNVIGCWTNLKQIWQ